MATFLTPWLAYSKKLAGARAPSQDREGAAPGARLHRPVPVAPPMGTRGAAGGGGEGGGAMDGGGAARVLALWWGWGLTGWVGYQVESALQFGTI